MLNGILAVSNFIEVFSVSGLRIAKGWARLTPKTANELVS
jgi:hypothetical protein